MSEKDLLLLLLCLLWLLSALSCAPPDRDGDGSNTLLDCDDAHPAVYPGAPEQPYNQLDEDCNGTDLIDVDLDGHPALIAGGDDCDDLDPFTHPDAPEQCDGIANDCSQFPDDADHDGWEAQACLEPIYWGDCDDLDPSIFPHADEIPYDGIDQNCYEGDLIDIDQDGEASIHAGGPDCDDLNPAITSAQETFIPAGYFYASRWPAPDHPTSPNAGLERRFLPDFCIDTTEVSLRTYRRCQATWECPIPSGIQQDPSWMTWYQDPLQQDFPVVGLSASDALNVCAAQGKRLPSHDEWEKAARGGLCLENTRPCPDHTLNPSPQRTFPWGENKPTCTLANHTPSETSACYTPTPESHAPPVVAVNTLTPGASPYGVLNLSGNAAEWVTDPPGSFQSAQAHQPPHFGNSAAREHLSLANIRGGNFESSPEALEISQRSTYTPQMNLMGLGTRCVRSLESSSDARISPSSP